jgi:adenosylmethionine-8-amino-7-oxononanoate aminotransferase
MYKPILPEKTQFISPCNPRRDTKKGESVAQYVERLADELECKILDLGPETVAGFVMEPVVGAVRGNEILFRLFIHSHMNTGTWMRSRFTRLPYGDETSVQEIRGAFHSG